jgi:putative membrane protein
MFNITKPNNLIWVLSILHIVGIGGFAVCGFWNSWFTFLVPFHLIITATALIVGNQHKSKSFSIRLAMVGIVGYLIEILGVKTGLIFGNYQYEGALGIKMANVPPLIGLNWILMIYSSITVLQQFRIKNTALVIVIGAICITLLDLLIEPVAIELNFWSWQNNIVPLQNYIGWFITALLLNAILVIGNSKNNKNALALPIFLMQIAFFGSLYLKILLFGSC